MPLWTLSIDSKFEDEIKIKMVNNKTQTSLQSMHKEWDENPRLLYL